MKRILPFLYIVILLWPAVVWSIDSPPDLIPRQQLSKFTDPPLPPEASVDQIVIKFHEGTHIRLRGGLLTGLPRNRRENERLASLGLTEEQVQADLHALRALLASSRQARGLERLFTASEEKLKERRTSGEDRSGRELADLDLYYRVRVPPGTTHVEVESLVDALRALPSIETAYAQPMARLPADIPPTTPDFSGNQGYLAASPQGIDALYAWTVPGGRGTGVKVVDVELAWRTSHEDFPSLFYQGGGPQPDVAGWRDHGTAALGTVVAVNNGYGATGIAHQAQAGVENVYAQSTASGILNAAVAAGPGGLVLIEVQYGGPPTPSSPCNCSGTCCDCVPVEYFQADYDAISQATANGTIVLEAGGNGATDLDDPLYSNKFNRLARDSGAVLVGASNSLDRAPTCFTNYGSRIDVHGWGWEVTTLGYGNLFGGGDENQFYTYDFGGTSSATPIVTGAAASIQGAALAAGRGNIGTTEMRQLLRETGAPQTADSRQIGPLPNLRAAIDRMLAYDAQILGQSVPSTMVAGRSYSASLTLKNVGTQAWDAVGPQPQCNVYRLGSANPQDNLTWGRIRVDLPATVASGQQVTVPFTITAPATPGTYNFQWRMIKECFAWFGDLSPGTSVTVQAPPPKDAQFVAQSVPSTMVAGDRYTVSLTIKNIGSETWSTLGPQCNAYRLGSDNPQDNSTWGLGRVDLTGPVAPGQQTTVSFTVTAPTTPGPYNFQWRMLHDCVTWFGSPSTNVPVTVGARLAKDARFLAQNVPATMVAGKSYTVSLTLRNVGTQAWDPVGSQPQCNVFRLGSDNPQDNLTWGRLRADLPATVAPGSDVTVSFTVTAPATPGTYNFQWRMLHECIAWLGEPSPNVAVQVRAGSTQDAQVLEQSVPTTMVAGQVYSVSLKLKNVGTQAWDAVGPQPQCNVFRLGSSNPQGNSTWGRIRADLPATAAPGQEVTVGFTVTAPSTPGTYNFQWRMLQECVAWFGDASPNVVVTVRSGSAKDAQILSQSLPTIVTAGQSYAATVKVKNVGTQAWDLVGPQPQCNVYRLGSVHPSDLAVWGRIRADLPAQVLPGQEATINFNITAPSAPGAYNFQWEMLHECVAWFGDPGPGLLVTVVQ